jgi:hypothetical protein
MELPGLEHVVLYCRSFQARHGPPDPELEAYLAQLLVVKVAAVVEEYLEECFTSRARKTGDPRIVTLVEDLIEKYFRNPQWSEVKGRLSTLGDDLVDSVMKNSTEQQRQALSDIVSHRHDVAHTRSPSVTLGEALRWWDQARDLVTMIGDTVVNMT